MTRVGLLLECGRDGLEAVVCRRLCQLMAVDGGLQLDVEIVPMGNKDQLLMDCGSAARTLLAGGCERVVILWDERPAWPDLHKPTCWHKDRQQALARLTAAGVPQARAHLVCIEREFESWLLFDHKMLECVLSSPTRAVRVPKQNNPHRHANPKGQMITLFRKLGRKTYVDVQFAQRIAQCIDTLSRFRKCATFKRFEARIIGEW